MTVRSEGPLGVAPGLGWPTHERTPSSEREGAVGWLGVESPRLDARPEPSASDEGATPQSTTPADGVDA